MSDYNKPSCSRSGGTLVCNVKPKHVRSLNFGQSILELNAIDQCYVPNRVLVIDKNVAHIPCTEKKDYVLKWLETLENGKCDPSQMSTVLETSNTTASQTSPILGKGRKRFNRKICVNRNAAERRQGNVDHQENAGHSANYIWSNNKSNDEYKKNSKENKPTSETQLTPSDTKKIVVDETSPILGMHRIFKKKRRKKLQYKVEDSVSPESSKLPDPKNSGPNIKLITKPDSYCNNPREMPMDQDKLENNLDIKTETFIIWTQAKESPEKYQKYIETISPSTQEKLSFANSSSNDTDRNDSRIETGTNNDTKNEEYNGLTNTSSSNSNLSHFIEDVDTQEIAKTSQSLIVDKYSIPSGQPFDLDEVYCSEAEMKPNQSIPLSTKVSEVQSLSKTTQKTGSKSTQTAIISTITTPSKKSPNRNMFAHLLNSEKKRRRPKKGSMAARLHSLINAQVSSIRIWRYRLNKEHDITSAQYISIFVHECTKQFSNQFLKGVLIEDRFNLLQSDEQAEAQNTQVQLKEVSYKNITIMLVCDIVGTLKMISKVIINVYPPWNILDKDDLTLEAMISVIGTHSRWLCSHYDLPAFCCQCQEYQEVV
ncbi:PREDICTED: uncharacterized protein LOC108772117 [Cyphomyrmex costatus]|uniref:uncharacterized protein LOC108772117 n=1 Tax=Cyphomyrmex costatus TaxID=456900 RepID=UPI00085227EA|nr:PREDICTED: uncharacterized protein LOC108772117 [Cyphomyrmex costatus]